jgi:hypothetical protein
VCFHVLCIVPPIPASPFLLPLFCLAWVCPEHPPSSSRLQTSCHIFLSLTYLHTYLPTYLSSSCFCTFLSFWENLWYKLVLFCAQACTYHSQSTREHPQSALDFRPLSHLSLSLTYLPIFLLFSHFSLWENLSYKLVLSGWLVGWCTSMFRQYNSQQNMIVDFFFFKFHFCWEILRVFKFLEAQTIDPTWQAIGSPQDNKVIGRGLAGVSLADH